ncbi:MAG: phosphoribosylformylglycinamidine cyclo-ligase [Elusimicrobia bacterium]|nr:phosphoribosylformylglycinamidine cyclo-ligase [Elusimicrobiota bacterium]
MRPIRHLKRVAYASSGVHLGDAYELLKTITQTTKRPITHFASIVPLKLDFRLQTSDFRLAFSADGVGTKSEILRLLGRNWVSGWDCVAMNANDILCAGAAPLWFLDYYAQGRLDKKIFKQVLSGIQKAVVFLGAVLVGGETAEMPGLFKMPEAYDVAGFLVGKISPPVAVGPDFVKPGDLLVGLKSSGPHSNGFSLIRKVLTFKEIKRHADALCRPTRLYHNLVYPHLFPSPLEGDGRVRGPSKNFQFIHSLAHITGGGFAEKLARAIGPSCRAIVNLGAWKVPPIFRFIQDKAGLSDEKMCGVLNMGIGFVLIADPKALARLERSIKEKFSVIGEIVPRKPSEPAVEIVV